MTLRELENERNNLRKHRDELKKQMRNLQQQIDELQKQIAPQMSQQQVNVALSRTPYTEMLLEIQVPYAKKNPSISEIESKLRNELGGKYEVLKVRVENYDFIAYSDPSFGAFYSGTITVRVKVKGDLPVHKGDTILLKGKSATPIKGLLVEAIVLVLAAIAFLIVADKVGARVLEVHKGYIEEAIKIMPYLITGGVLFLGIVIWLKWKR